MIAKLDRKKQHTKYMVDDIQCPGVTTIMGELSKPFLVTWANQQGLKGINTATDREALDIGTIAHFLIESHISKTEPDLRDYAPVDVDKAKIAFQGYLKLEEKHKIIYIKNELSLVSRKHFFGGTCDMYCEIDGLKTLVDFKTSKKIYPEYFIQCAAYKELLIENGYPVEQEYIFRIDKETGDFEDKKLNLTTKEFDFFLLLQRVYRCRKELKI
jgi:hypothetical protein